MVPHLPYVGTIQPYTHSTARASAANKNGKDWRSGTRGMVAWMQS